MAAAPSINLTFGAVFDGFDISLALYGVTCCQAILYFRHFRDDRTWLKSIVSFTWLMDTLQQIFQAHALWHYLIAIRASQDLEHAGIANWSLIGQVIPTEFAAVTVQLFFVGRIRMLDDRKWRSLVLLFPMLISVVASIAYVVKCYKLPAFVSGAKEEWILGIFAVSRCFTDVAIALSMCCLLYGQYRDDLTQRSVSLVKVLFQHTLTTGLLTSFCAIIYVTAYLTMPLNMVYIAIYFIHGKVYANSMLAALNSRRSLRLLAEQDIVLHPVHFSSFSDIEPRRKKFFPMR